MFSFKGWPSSSVTWTRDGVIIDSRYNKPLIGQLLNNSILIGHFQLGGDQPWQKQEHNEAGAAWSVKHGPDPGMWGKQQQPHPASHRQDWHQHELWVS